MSLSTKALTSETESRDFYPETQWNRRRHTQLLQSTLNRKEPHFHLATDHSHNWHASSCVSMNGEVVSETGLAARLAVACTWCSKSIGHRSGHKSPIPKSPLSSSSSASSSPPPPVAGKKGKDESECTCRKPRSRCALCLSRLNTSSSLALFAQKRRPDSALPKFPFDSFTVFCATCRHSGHAVHYLEWFTSHKNCPVAGCTCTCFSLDPVLRLDHHSHHSG